jgi:hypothetical protein
MLNVLLFALLMLVVVGIVCAIVYQIPFPPALAWMKWAIPVLALVIALVVIIDHLSPAL